MGEDNPIIFADKSVKDALFVMTEKGLGAVSIIDKDGKFIGLITDGMIRRSLAEDNNFLDERVREIMFKTPLIIRPDAMAASALHVMESHKPNPITVLPVINKTGNPVGIVHLTDLLRNGVI